MGGGAVERSQPKVIYEVARVCVSQNYCRNDGSILDAKQNKFIPMNYCGGSRLYLCLFRAARIQMKICHIALVHGARSINSSNCPVLSLMYSVRNCLPFFEGTAQIDM